jgi:hypothetical protein
MEPKDLLPILFERSNAAVTLWNIEIVVVLGLIAFLASAGKMIGHWSMKLALTVGFLVMAGNNVVALIEVMEQRQALVDFFRTLKSPVLALPPWAKPASIGFRPAVARCCKIGSRPNPDRAVERHMARESFHEGEDGRRYGVMIINFRSCSAERCRPRPSEVAFLRLQSRRSLGDLTKGEVGAAAVNIGRTVDPRSSPDAPPMELPRHAPS